MTELKATEPIEQLFEKLKVDAVFGQPIQEGDVTIIPVAEIGVGFGFGSGQGPAADGTGSMMGMSRPTAVQVGLAAAVVAKQPRAVS